MRFPSNARVSPTRFIVVGVIFLITCMIAFPTAVFQASKAGVAAWWNIVFPALLPFFISSELLMGYGVIQFMGVLLEPVMRPLFNLPGVGSFVVAVGFTSGFPISASLAARLRRENMCTRLEGERLMAFTNNASPLFMLVAVGVGMFKNPRLGVLIAVCHYAANLLLGLLLRYYKTDDPEFSPRLYHRHNLVRRAMAEMKKAFRANPRPFGKMLGDAISSSVSKLLVIGGFVIVFAVIIRLSAIIGLTSFINSFIGLLTGPLGFSTETVQSMGTGFFEITLGTKATSEAVAPLAQKVIAASMILGWSGVSVLAQVSAMISETDLRMGLFVLGRAFHAVVSGVFCYLLLVNQSVQSWLAKPISAGLLAQHSVSSWFATLFCYGRLCGLAVLAWAVAALLVYVIRSFSVVRLKI